MPIRLRQRAVAALLFALALQSTAVPAQGAPPAGGFRQVRTETTASPGREFASVARVQHDLCNLNRRNAGLPARAFPALPDAFVTERSWQATNGRDFVLQTRRFGIEVAAPATGDGNDCGGRLVWSEVVLIHRGGRTTRIDRSSDSPTQVDRDAWFGGISPVREADFPTRTALSATLGARCGNPSDYAPAAAYPGARIEEICVAANGPGFHDEDGMPLTLRMRGQVRLAGANFAIAVRTVSDGAYTPTAATWNPASYVDAAAP
jgi:hypothetical protein